MHLRTATAHDSALIAHLHAESWRSAYAGLLDPVYLAGPVDRDRFGLWVARLANPAPDITVTVAERDGQALGFACALGGGHEPWGTLIDNLHVHPGQKGRGVGRLLIGAMARWSVRIDPSVAIHVWCLEENGPARRFYERCGGRVTGREVHAMPDGNALPALRFSWADAGVLIDPA